MVEFPFTQQYSKEYNSKMVLSPRCFHLAINPLRTRVISSPCDRHDPPTKTFIKGK